MLTASWKTASKPRTAWSRCRAVLLALLLLGGQYGPQLADMLLAHRTVTVQTHIEQQKDQACHAERCMLGYVGPTAHLASLAPPLARLAMPMAVRSSVPAAVAGFGLSVRSLPRPRGPPPVSA